MYFDSSVPPNLCLILARFTGGKKAFGFLVAGSPYDSARIYFEFVDTRSGDVLYASTRDAQEHGHGLRRLRRVA
jgi:hypothetical protein